MVDATPKKSTRGRKKDLPEVKRLKGKDKSKPPEDPKAGPEPTGDARVDAERIVAAGFPDWAPNHATEEVRDVLRNVRDAMPPGVYTQADSDILHAYAIAVVMHREAVRCLFGLKGPNGEQYGKVDWTVISSTGSEKKSPWITIMNEQAIMVKQLGAVLGLSPVSRQAMLPPPGARDEDPFAGLIGDTGRPN